MIKQNTTLYAKWKRGAFITLWQTSTANESITLPLVPTGIYDFVVDWGDGTSHTITRYNTVLRSHTYAKASQYIVSITGHIEGFSFYHAYQDDGRSPNIAQLYDIKQWGVLKLGNTEHSERYFVNGMNFTKLTPSDVPDLTGTTNLAYMFWGTENLTSINNLEKWDVSQITTMEGMFTNNISFNQDIGNWNTSNVTNMGDMFNFGWAFNQDLSKWDVRKVTYHGGFSDNTKVWVLPKPNFPK